MANIFEKIIDSTAILVNEFLSEFVARPVKYRISGECKKCGKCCNYMYSYDTYTEKEFKIMQLIFPAYRRFYIKGKDEDGRLIFACKLVRKDGLCSDYKHRPRVCRKYPAKFITYKGKLHDGCGYKIEDINFKDYLK